MRDDFGIFILTHGRAKEQKTYGTLKRTGYTGKIFLVVDDLDEQVEEYKKIYGEQVLIFDKVDAWKKTDTMINRRELSAVVYARNVCFDFAEKHGLKYFCMCDDDISEMKYRFIMGKKLSAVKVRQKMDNIISAMVRYMETEKITVLGMCEAGAYIGGINQLVLSGWSWHLSKFMMYRTADKVNYRGTWYEDTISTFDIGLSGRCAFSVSILSITSPSTGSNKGGMHETYENANSYISSFMVLVAHPSSVKIVQRSKMFNIRREAAKAIPVVISGRYKKDREKVEK